MKNRFLDLWLAAGTLAIIACCPGVAQTITGSINGLVTDQNGAVVPNATVIARNIATGVETSGSTNGSGNYSLRFLQIGQYTITINQTGFKTSTFGPFTLEVDQTAKVDAKLTVGSTTETVTVSNELAPILNTENSTIATTFTANTIQNIPLNGRNFSTLTLYLPGAVSTQSNGMSGSNGTERNTGSNGQVSINANRLQSNNYRLDGIEINETINNLIGYNPSPDALQEVKVISSNAPAEYGNVNGGDIIALTKSGTNQFHGSAYGFLENWNLDANTWNHKNHPDPTEIQPRDHYTQKLYGATFGGPIKRDKLFFFVDYAATRRPTGGTTADSLATPAMRQGDFSALLNGPWVSQFGNTPIQLYRQVSPGVVAAYANNQVPVVSTAAQYLFAHPEYYPLPNTAPLDGLIQNNYVAPYKSLIRNDQGDVKIDWKATDHDSLLARYSQGEAGDVNPNGYNLPVAFTSGDNYPTKGVALNYVHVFSPAIVNEFRAGFTRVRWQGGFPEDTTGAFGLKGNSLLGIPGTQAYPGFSGLSFNSCPNGGSCYNNPTNLGNPAGGTAFVDNSFIYGDNLTWQKQHHLIKFGAQFVRYQQNSYFAGADGANGSFQFYNSFTGNPLTGTPGYTFADFLLNKSSFVGIGGVAGPTGQRQWRDAYFVQDDWKYLPNLTFNIGVRYEYDQPIYEVNNKMLNINLDTGALEFAGQDGNSRALYNPAYTNAMPRLGFAYSPNDRTVIRGGYGITAYLEGTGSGLRLTQNFPFLRSFEERAILPTATTVGTPFSINSGFATGSGNVTNNNGTTYFAYAKNLRPSVVQEFSLTTEYQLSNTASVSASYIGETGQHLIDARDGNQWTRPNDPTSAPYYNTLFKGGQGNIKITESASMFNYNSAQVSYRQRVSHGLEYTVNYTYAKGLTNNPGFFGTPAITGPSAYWQNAYDGGADYGPSGFDIRHNLNFTGVWQLPFGRGQQFGRNINRVVDEAIGGWKFSTAGTFYTGFPITMGGPTNYNINSFATRPNQYRKLKIVHQSVRQWFGNDPSSVGCQTPGVDNGVCAYGGESTTSFGTARVGTERAPDYRQVDMSLFKDFHLFEGHVINFRADFFNALNISSYGNPDNYVLDGPGTFGQITDTRSGPRQIQFAAKYLF